ncbi:MAG: hypothetical protein HQL26_00900 [Candidatus Omnitrophica bacterium]|nr:hypothetical protein [Candidatus Omnitrophota bacterium]
MKKPLIFILAFMVISMSVRPGFAEEKFEDTATGKAAKETIEAMSNFLSDWAEISSLPLEQKIAVVRKNAQKRIWDKMKDQQWGVTKNAITEYAKARLRQDMFRAASLGMMHECIVEGKNVAEMWSKADIDIKSKIEPRIAALGKVLDGVEISWATYRKWNEGKPDEAMTDMGKAIADKVMEFFIPGWGYYRLAQGMVEALGKWVMAYAFDTALEGKINAIAPVAPKQNPEAFAQWLLTVDNIPAFVKREWDEQIGYTGLYAKYDGDDKTKDEFGDAMEKKIVETLETMKTEALKRKTVENELKTKLQEEDRKAADLLKKVQDATAKTQAAMDQALMPLKKFEEKYYGLVKQDTQEVVAEAEQSYEKVQNDVPDPSAYSPMDRGSVINALENEYAQVGESYSKGYDENEMQKQGELVAKIRAEQLKKVSDQIAEAEKNVFAKNNERNDASQPYFVQSNAIWDAWYRSGKPIPAAEKQRMDDLIKQGGAISKSFEPAVLEAIKKQTSVNALAGQDRARLAAEEKLVVVDAQERFAKAVQLLAKEIPLIQQDVDFAYKNFEIALKAFQDESVNLNYPQAYDNVGGPYFTSLGYIPSHQNYPLDIQQVISPSRLALKKWEADAVLAPQLEAMREKMDNDYNLAIMAAKNRFDNLVGAKHQLIRDQYWGAQVYNWVPDAVFPAELAINIPYLTGKGFKRDVAALYKKEVEALRKQVNELNELEPSVDLAVAFWNIFSRLGRLTAYEDDALNKIDVASLCKKNGDNYGFSVDPADSDGAKFIEDMKTVWDANKVKILGLKDVREKFIKAAVMKFQFSDPRDDKLLDMYLKIPDRIAEFEKTLANAKAERERAMKSIVDNAAQFVQQYETILKENKDSRDRIKRLKLLQDGIRMSMSLFPSSKSLTEPAAKAWDQITLFNGKLTKYVEKLQKDINSGIYWDQNEGPFSPKPPISYVISNTFVNGISSNGLSAEVVLTTSDLKNGKIEIGGQLSTIDEIKEIAIAEDGQSWSVLPKQTQYVYAFTPHPQGIYTPQIRITTMTDQIRILPVFMNIQRIIFKDFNYEQAVVESVSKIADSYEQQNFGVFSDYISREFIGNKSMVESGIREDFATFSDVHLNLRISRIERRGQLFAADTEWDKTQKIRQNNKNLNSKGRTTFMFILEDDHMKVKSLRGDLLYAVLSKEMAQACGASLSTVDKLLQATGKIPSPSGPDTPTPDTKPSDENEPSVPDANTLDKGTFTLKQFNAHPGMSGFAQSYRFATKQVVDDAMFDLTGDFRRREGWIEAGSGAGVLDLGSIGLNNITEVPANGYQQAIGATVGHVYAVQLSNGTYAIVEFQSADGDPSDLYQGRPISARLQYLYQKNGTRLFK